jgi:hypothetical protein
MWTGSELHSTALTEHPRSNKITFTSSAVFLANPISVIGLQQLWNILSDILRQTMGKSKRAIFRSRLKDLFVLLESKIARMTLLLSVNYAVPTTFGRYFVIINS